MGVVSRMGSGRDAGKTGDDPDEPVATLTVAPGAGMQWAVYPINRDAIATNWGHEMATERWVHVAVVNDGHHSVMYIEGSRVLRNPRAENIGFDHRRALAGRRHHLRPRGRAVVLRLDRRRAHLGPRPAGGPVHERPAAALGR